jgi:hypothetical protein
MPITESVIEEVRKRASKDRAITGLTFMNKYGIEYKSDKEEEDNIMEERRIEMAPFPDVPAESLGMMTQYENLVSGEDVNENEPISNNEEQASLATENSGLVFGPVTNTHIGEVIELLDGNEEDALNEGIRNNIVLPATKNENFLKLS